MVELELEKVIEYSDTMNSLLFHSKNDRNLITTIPIGSRAAALDIQMKLDEKLLPVSSMFDFLTGGALEFLGCTVPEINIRPAEEKISPFFKQKYGMNYDIWDTDLKISDKVYDARLSDAVRLIDKDTKICVDEKYLQNREDIIEVVGELKKIDYSSVVDGWKNLERVTHRGRPMNVYGSRISNSGQIHLLHLKTNKGEVPISLTQTQYEFYQLADKKINIKVDNIEKPDSYTLISKIIQDQGAHFEKVTASVGYSYAGIVAVCEGPSILVSSQGEKYRSRLNSQDAIILSKRDLNVQLAIRIGVGMKKFMEETQEKIQPLYI